MDAGAPERFVDVDVPQACDRPLVEQRSLHRRTPAGEPLAESPGREGSLERLTAEPLRKVRAELVGLEQEPRAEAADVTIRNIRSVV